MTKIQLGFGDIVQFELGTDTVQGFVIGEDITSTVDEQIVVVASTHNIGMLVKGDCCRVVATGYHIVAHNLQTKYLETFPGTLLGLFPDMQLPDLHKLAKIEKTESNGRPDNITPSTD